MVLFAYAQGIVSSRGIAAACREHVTFIALCGDSAPHFTTIAGFVSALGDEVRFNRSCLPPEAQLAMHIDNAT